MKKVHYAWFVCAGCALLLFCTSGLAINAFSIYQPYIISLNGFSNTQASSMLVFRNCASLISMFFVGKYYRKLGMRRGLTLIGAVLVAGYVLYGTAGAYWQYCLASALAGIAYGSGTMIPIAILLNRWFLEKKDTAIGICSAVTGISTLGIPSLLSRCIETNGLRFTFCAEAAVMCVLVVLSCCLLRNSPGEMDLLPYGFERSSSNADAAESETDGHDLPRFALVLMVVMILFVGGVMNVAYSHLPVLITGEGAGENVAALAMTFSGLALMLGKIVYGRLEDLWGTVKCNCIFAPVLLAGLVLCCRIGKQPRLIYPAISLYSFGIACLSVGLSTWPLELSSSGHRDRCIQIFMIAYAGGSLVFAPLPGILADRFNGSYLPAFRLFLVLAVIVFITVQIILIRQKRCAQ